MLLLLLMCGFQVNINAEEVREIAQSTCVSDSSESRLLAIDLLSTYDANLIDIILDVWPTCASTEVLLSIIEKKFSSGNEARIIESLDKFPALINVVLKHDLEKQASGIIKKNVLESASLPPEWYEAAAKLGDFELYDRIKAEFLETRNRELFANVLEALPFEVRKQLALDAWRKDSHEDLRQSIWTAFFAAKTGESSALKYLLTTYCRQEAKNMSLHQQRKLLENVLEDITLTFACDVIYKSGELNLLYSETYLKWELLSVQSW